MGILTTGDGRATLHERTFVGRSQGSTICLRDDRVSGEHALISWSRGVWSVRDLGSRNGTWLDGRRLEAGERSPLRRGSVLQFSGPTHEWVLFDADGPKAHARRVDGGSSRTAEGGVLALPDDDRLALTVFRSDRGGWVAEDADGALCRVTDRSVVHVDGAAWQLYLPQSLDPTLAARDLPELRLEFLVSPDEEYAELTVVEPTRRTLLKPRAHHYFLVTLARHRLACDGPQAERGWLTEQELSRMLRVDRQTIKVQIFRARKELGKLGLRSAHHIVERRTGTGLMRIGVESLKVTVR